MAVLYTHTRIDTGDVFYVGIGSKLDRAFDTRSRNKIWKGIVSRVNYVVDILYENISWEDACSMEKVLIKRIGRIDLGTGTLANMTDGGDGTLNPSKTSKDKRMQTLKETGEYDKMIKRITSCKRGTRANKVYVYDMCGCFIDEFNSFTSASIFLKSSVSQISTSINKYGAVKRHLVFSRFIGDRIYVPEAVLNRPSEKARNAVKKRSVSVLNETTGDIRHFVALKDASVFLGMCDRFVSNRIRANLLTYNNYKIILN